MTFENHIMRQAKDLWKQYGDGGNLTEQNQSKVKEFYLKAYYRMGKHQEDKEIFEIYFVDGSYFEILASHAVMINSYSVVADGTEITFGHPMIVDFERSSITMMREDAEPGEFQER